MAKLDPADAITLVLRDFRDRAGTCYGILTGTDTDDPRYARQSDADQQNAQDETENGLEGTHVYRSTRLGQSVCPCPNH
jgi:hypothetical protein